MPLDPLAQALIVETNALGLPATPALSPVEARKALHIKLANIDDQAPIEHVENYFVPCPAHQIPVRVYLPKSNALLPVIVYFHGGGWVLGDLESHDCFCRRLAEVCACAVVAVDYRLAPEHKFPSGLEDCYTAVQWVSANAARLHIDPLRIAVGGDSAGGNLAAGVALLARERRDVNLVYQVLIYPITDYWLPGTPSYTECAAGYSLGRDTMIWFWLHYVVAGTSPDNPYLCPLHAVDLRELPPAMVITAEYDVLRDEGERYAERLQAAGVSTILKRYDGMMHGFCQHYRRFSQARQLVLDIARALPWS